VELKHIAQRQGRLSSFLRNEIAMSAGLVNRLKWQNKIFVNGRPEHNDYAVQPGDVITAALDEETPSYPPEDGPLTIIYEDEHILAVDKPAGMLIHPSRATMTGTLANRVLAHYQKTGQSCAFHPLTRLDRDTFGIVLIAKNSHIHMLLGEKQKVEKTYEARVFGVPDPIEGEIDAPIARRPLPSLLRYVNQEGKPSVTRYKVLSTDGQTSLLELQPVTGRTHQLRVHCAYMGFPILGDPQYGTADSVKFSEEQGIHGQRLCAKALSFMHPVTGAPMTLRSRLSS